MSDPSAPRDSEADQPERPGDEHPSGSGGEPAPVGEDEPDTGGAEGTGPSPATPGTVDRP